MKMIRSASRRVPVVLVLAVLVTWATHAAARTTVAEESLPKLEKTGVVVPWEDFRKILEEIRRVEPVAPPAPPPVDFAPSACNVAAVVNDDETQARVRMEYSVQVLATDHWVEVPVIAEGVALSRFEIDGRLANVYQKSGTHRIALRGEGRHDLVLEYLTAVTDGRGTKTAVLRFPQAPVISLELSVPRPSLSFNIGGAVVRSTERSNGTTRVLAAFQQARDASVTWFKQAELDEKETKVFGELRTLLSVGEGMLRGSTVAAYTVHGRGADAFRIGLPGNVTVLDVSAQGIDDWSVAPAPAGETEEPEGGPEKILTVRLNYLARGSYAFRFTFEQPLGDTTAVTDVPDLTILDAIRDKGFIAVAAATNVEINPKGPIENATPIDPAELPGDLPLEAGGQVLYAFKYLRHPVGIVLDIVKHEDLAVKRTIVESARLFTYLSPEGKRITSARYRVKNNRKQYLEVALPEGSEVWGTYLEDVPVKAARTSDGKVLIPLRKTASNADGELAPFEIELVYFEKMRPHSWGLYRLAGPELDVDAMEVHWHVFLPRDKRYAGFSGNLHPDEDLNRIVYVDKTAWNLESREDRDVLRRSGLAGHEMAQLEGTEQGALVGEDEEAPDKDARDALENELRSLKERAAAPQEPNARGPATQVMSNVAASVGDYYRGGGRTVGVLPVRFNIPVDGLRLSFTGRILTADEAPYVSVRYWPAVWVLSRTAVFFIALGLSVSLLLLLASGRPVAVRLAAAIPVVVVLVGLFVLVPAHRAAFLAGLLIPIAARAAARFLLGRRRAVEALSLLVVALFATAAAAPAAHAVPSRIPDLPGTEVTLSWQDFKGLVEKTYVPPPVPPKPPADAFLREAEYTGRLEPGVLTLEGTLALEVLADGWVRVPLTTEGTVLRFDGDGALLNRNGSGLEVLARGPRAYTLKVSLAFEAGDHPGENRIALHLPSAPRNLLDLTAGKGFRDIEVESGLAYATRDDHVFLSLTDGAFAMKYTRPFQRIEETAGEVVELEPRVQLASYQMLTLGDGVIGGLLIHDYQVRVAKVSHFDIDLPEAVAVFDCNVSGLESWKILKRDGQRYLRVKLLAPAEGAVRVIVSFEGSYDPEAGRVTVPRFVATDIERESGFVAVAADGAEIELSLSGNLLPADVAEMPADVRAYGGNLISAFKYSGAPDGASVSVIEHEDAPVLTAIIESLNATAALLDDGTEATWIDLLVKNNRKQFLRFTLPAEDVEVWSLLLDGAPAKPKRTGEAVLVPLPRGSGETASRISLVLLRRGSRVRSFGRVEPYLPDFDVPVSEALWTVYLPEGRRYVTTGRGGFRPVVVSDPLVPDTADLGALGYVAGRSSAALKQSYDAVVSEPVAEEQVRQEEYVARQIAQKGGGRKGALPVRIAIPGGVDRLPRVTVSRMLIVGEEGNTFTIRVYPAWIGSALRILQPVLILGAALALGLMMAGMVSRRALVPAAAAAVAGLFPFGGISPITAFVMLALLTGLCRLAVALVRRHEARRSPA